MNAVKNLENTGLHVYNKNEEFTQYFTFLLGNEKFGIKVCIVKEVIEYSNVFKIPTMPDFIMGVINLRGEVVPVIDLTSKFFGHTGTLTVSSSIVIVEIEHMQKLVLIGVLIDRINSVLNIFHSNIESIPDFGSKIRPDYISDIGKVDNEFIILLNIYKVLDIEEISQIEM